MSLLDNPNEKANTKDPEFKIASETLVRLPI